MLAIFKWPFAGLGLLFGHVKKGQARLVQKVFGNIWTHFFVVYNLQGSKKSRQLKTGMSVATFSVIIMKSRILLGYKKDLIGSNSFLK